jgi:HlyD family secretion protein
MSNFSLFAKKRLAGIIIILAAIAVFILLKMTREEQPVAATKQKIWPVETLSVKLESLSPVYTLYGSVESHSLVTASAPVSGVMAAVPVKEGDEFESGQLLAAIATADIDIPFAVARADVADSEAQLKLQDLGYQANLERLRHEKEVLKIKQQDVQRNRDLIQKKLTSQSALDISKEALTRQEFSVVGAELSVEENMARVAQLQARVEKARANFQQAEINRGRGVVTAPFSGRIADVHVSAGDRVGVNTPMISYYETDSLELRAQIPVAHMALVYRALQQQDQLIARYRFNQKNYELKLSRLAGQASPSGVDAFFEIPDSLKVLRPGDLLEVQLSGQAIENSFSLPYSAIYGSDRIYRVENGELQAVTVTLLGDTLVNGKLWALVKGDVAPGTVIVTTHLPNAISGLKVTEIKTDD